VSFVIQTPHPNSANGRALPKGAWRRFRGSRVSRAATSSAAPTREPDSARR